MVHIASLHWGIKFEDVGKRRVIHLQILHLEAEPPVGVLNLNHQFTEAFR